MRNTTGWGWMLLSIVLGTCVPALADPVVQDITESRLNYDLRAYQPVDGQLLLCEDRVNSASNNCIGAISDILIFETNLLGVPFQARFLSDASLDVVGDTDAADTGFSGVTFTNVFAVQESSSGTTSYAPTSSTQPGFRQRGTGGITYQICSDAPPRSPEPSDGADTCACVQCMPEPSTILLLLPGAVLLATRAGRRRVRRMM